jgi:hypothetical protein
MAAHSPKIEWALDQFRQGKRDEAFFCLVEEDGSILPELMEEFVKEQDVVTQAFLVEVVWHYRDPRTIPFLGKALSSSSPLVWKESLDGLVTLASPEALDVLTAVRSRSLSKPEKKAEFVEWLDEAIDQIQDRLANRE